MDSGNNYAEFTVEKKCEGAYKMKRIGMKLLLWMPLFLLGLLGQLITRTPVIWVILIPVYPLIWLKILKPTFYPYVYIEYEYSIVGGEMRFAEVLGKCKRRELFAVKIGDMKAIAPYEEPYKAAADNPEIKKRYELVSTMKAEELYYAIFEKDEEPCVVFFQPTNKVLSLLRFHNRLTVVKRVNI